MPILNFTEAVAPQKAQFLSDIETFRAEMEKQLPERYTIGEIKERMVINTLIHFFDVTREDEKQGSIRMRIEITPEGLVCCKFNTNNPVFFNGKSNYAGSTNNAMLKKGLPEDVYNNYDTWQPSESLLQNILPGVCAWLQDK